MPKWVWFPGAMLLGAILGVNTIHWSKIMTYGVWALVLVVLVYASGWVTRDMRIATYSGVVLWTTALIVYEGLVDWHLWQRWHYPVDWTSTGLGFLLIALVGLPGSYVIARKATQ